MKTTKYIKDLALLATFFTGVAMTSCEDEPDKYEIAEGLPTVHYVRLPDPAVADSLITGASLSNTVCIVGDNLRSVYELYFNDQKAILNTSLMTDHTINLEYQPDDRPYHYRRRTIDHSERGNRQDVLGQYQ